MDLSKIFKKTIFRINPLYQRDQKDTCIIFFKFRRMDIVDNF